MAPKWTNSRRRKSRTERPRVFYDAAEACNSKREGAGAEHGGDKPGAG